MSEVQAPAQPARDGPVGIGGRLILPLIGLCLTPIRGLISAGQFIELTSTLADLGRVQLAFVIAEILINAVLLIVVPIYLLTLLFQKKRGFPSMYARWGIASFVYILADLAIAGVVFRGVFSQPGTSLIDADTWKEIFRAFILVAIWVPYMLSSRRVANTFTQ